MRLDIKKFSTKTKNMKKIFQLLLLSMILLGSFKQANASHVAAADVFYEYIDPLVYKIHLVLYRDCKAGTAGLSGTDGMTASSVSCNQSIPFTVDTTGNNTRKIYGDLCPNIDNWCVNNASIFPGYEEWHYTAIVTLPMACTDWTFKYNTMCCRNNAISNLVGASGAGICVSATLNNVLRPINNSAFLSIKPIPYVCVNQPKVYLNGPIDPDLDSLVFVGTQPLNSGACAPIQWAGTSTTANPFGAGAPGGYVVNAQTGTASFTPTITGTYVVAFTCTEYDVPTGQPVGSIMRDVQLNVLNCNAAPPSDPNLTQDYTILNLTGATLQSPAPIVMTVCPGTAMSFDVQAISNSGSNAILATSNNASSCVGSNFVSNPLLGGNPVTGSFSWTPTAAQIGAHTLIVTFTDSTCTVAQPIVLKSYAVILINVLPGVDAGPDLTRCLGGDSSQLNVTGPPAVTQWAWTDINGNTNNIGLSSTTIKNPIAGPNVTTTYIVTAINPPPGLICKTIDTVTVNVVPGVTLSAGGNHTICANDSIQLTASCVPAQTSPVILWSNGAELNDSTILNPIASPLATTDFYLYFTDDNGCKYTDISKVTVSGVRAILNSSASENNVCPGYPFQLFSNPASMPCGLSVFPCNSAPSYSMIGAGNVQQNQFTPYFTNTSDAYKTQLLFTADELQTMGIGAGNIKSLSWIVTSKGSDTMRNLTISMGCTSETSLNGVTGFLQGLSVVYDTNKFYTSLGMNEHVFERDYFWDGVSNIVIQLCYNVTGNFNNQDVVTSSNTLNTQFMTQTAATGTGCGLAATSPQIAAVRPNTRFNACQTGSFTYNWNPGSTLDNPNTKDPYSSGIFSTTDFIVNVSASSNPNCVSKDTVQVVVDNSNSIVASVTPQVLCEPGYVTLTGTPVGPGPVYECGEENISCSAAFNQYTVGTGLTSNLSLTPLAAGSYAGSRSQMLYTVADLTALGITKGRIDSIALDIASQNSLSGYDIRVKIGCTPLSQLTGFIPSNELKQVYQNSSYLTTLGWNSFPFSSPFVWDGVKNIVVEICYFNGQNVLIGSDAVNYTNTVNPQFYTQSSNFGGCDIPLVQTPSVPISSTALPNMRFSICDIPTKNWPYRWQPGTFVYDSTSNTTKAYVNSSTTFSVFTKGGNKCEVKDSIRITISQHDLKVTPMDTTLCIGDAYQAFATGTGNAPSQTFFWYDENGGSAGLSCITCSNPIITPITPGAHTYTCTRLDSYGCGDTVTIKLFANPRPNVTILNGDSIKIKYQKQEINLVATGAQVYNWTPVWGLSNPNMSNTVASPAEPTLYTVYGISALGCRNWDSIYVDIDYHDNLYVPNAFSPNGDGNNDIFRVANLTFQNVQEFRVLNRWGQEIFNAGDNRGWNGTFKGKDQDPATYHYLIRVAYPDGSTKLFKGDVILIR
jgi:gliding motility-associated-like protein